MQKSASENTFLSFLRKNKSASALIFIFFLGILLLVFAQSGETSTATSSEEERIEELCSGISGVGECEVFLNIKDGDVVAVAILCDGADSPRTEADIKSFISSLYGIGYNKITVLKLSK